MCGPPTDAPVCDECWGKIQENVGSDEVKLCADCQELMERFCFCCGIAADKPIGEEGVCEDCVKHQTFDQEEYLSGTFLNKGGDDLEEPFEEIGDSEEGKG